MKQSPPTLMVVRRDGSMRPAARPRRERVPAPRFPVVIVFERGNALPAGQSLRKLQRCADWLMAYPAERLVLVGHANIRGERKAAQSLGAARTSAVYELLVWLGAGQNQVLRPSAVQLHKLQANSTRLQRARHRVVQLWRMTQSARPASKSRASKAKLTVPAALPDEERVPA